ncbi:unnamed protein product [Brassica oleracea]
MEMENNSPAFGEGSSRRIQQIISPTQQVESQRAPMIQRLGAPPPPSYKEAKPTKSSNSEGNERKASSKKGPIWESNGSSQNQRK